VLHQPLRIHGLILMACAVLLWIVGGNSVRRRSMKRRGEEPLAFDITQYSRVSLNTEEKRARLGFFAAAMVLGAIGTALANGAFG
jgi:hypothetical protein